MKAYWDSSALVEVILKRASAAAAFDAAHERITRVHALAETFSTLTGGRLRDQNGDPIRFDADDAAAAIAERAAKMKLVALSGEDTLRALRSAKKHGVRGGHIHDFIHARAAEAEKADKICTYNAMHFDPLTEIEVAKP